MTQLILNLLELALAIGVPALIARFAPRRWRLWAVGLWALTPLLILLGLAASEIASGKASPADLDKLVFGLLLIASVALLPWLATCAVGFGLGVLLRGRAPKAVAPEPTPTEASEELAKPAARAAPIRAPITDPTPLHGGPSLSPPAGWEAAHVGFANDNLVLDGLPVWSLTWRRESDEQVMLAHPAHPTQQHAFDVFNADDGARATRFAAAELSNGVWGFYRWRVPADAASGESADGTLRYEHGPGAHLGGRDDNIAPLARLYEAGSGALLFDGAAWQSSRIVPQTDGSLLLALEQRDLQTIFRIDPTAGVFRDLAVPNGARPLGELAGAAAAARAACDEPANAYLGRCIAPDGSLKVELQWVEWSNSHWVRSPRVTEIATGRVLLDLWGTDWDASPSFPRERAVRLSFRRYHAGGEAEAEIELAPDRYILIERAGSTFGPLDRLPQALERASRQSRTALSAKPRAAPIRPAARGWLVALLILVSALAVIAAATWVTLRLEGDRPPQRLDTIPAMPSAPDAGDRPAFQPRPSSAPPRANP